MDVFLELLGELLALVPSVAIAAPLIAALIDAGKQIGWIKDGYAGVVSGFLNLVAFAAMFVASRIGAEEEVGGIIIGLGELAPYLLALILSIVGSKLVHLAGKWSGTFGEKKAA